jgi:hypothetical protein
MFIDGLAQAVPLLKKPNYFKALGLQFFWILFYIYLYIGLTSNISKVGAEAYQNSHFYNVRYLSSR